MLRCGPRAFEARVVGALCNGTPQVSRRILYSALLRNPTGVVGIQNSSSSNFVHSGTSIKHTNGSNRSPKRRRKNLSPKARHRSLKHNLIRSLRRLVAEYSADKNSHKKLVKVRALVSQICNRAQTAQEQNMRQQSTNGNGTKSALPVISRSPVVFTPAEHTTLISTVAAHGLWQEALRLLQLAHDTGTISREGSRAALFQKFDSDRTGSASSGSGTSTSPMATLTASIAQQAQQLEKSQGHVGATTPHYNAAMYGCAVAGRHEQALDVLFTMEWQGVKRDIISYNTALHACRYVQYRDPKQ